MILEAHRWAGVSIEKSEKLAGDASTRSYFRIPFNNSTAILMIFADDETSLNQAGRFIKTQKWLSELDIPVPIIVRVSDCKHFFILILNQGFCIQVTL